MAPRPHPGDEAVAIDAGDRRLAGRIDAGDDHAVGIVEAGAELARTAIAGGYSGAAAPPRSPCPPSTSRAALQHGGDLDRMMAVIVDDRHAVPFAGAGEAAPTPPKLASAVRIRASAMPRSRATAIAAGRVEHVVAARHRQHEIVDACGRRRRMRSRNTTEKRDEPSAWSSSTSRTSACGFSP